MKEFIKILRINKCKTNLVLLSFVSFLMAGSLPLLAVGRGAIPAQEGEEACKIIKKSSDLVDYKSITMKISLKTFAPNGAVRVREMESSTLSTPEVTKMVMRITSPPDQKGVAMLIHDYKEKGDDMWIYLPSLRKSRRVVSSEKASQFMGSEFLNSDMSRPSTDDYRHTLTGSGSINNEVCWIIESIAKDATVAKESGFTKKVSYITKNDNLCRKVEFYDAKGALLRTQLISKFEKSGPGTYIAIEMEVINNRTQRKSLLEIIPEKSTTPPDSKLFDPARL